MQVIFFKSKRNNDIKIDDDDDDNLRKPALRYEIKVSHLPFKK